MDSNEFEILMDWCEISSDGNYMSFTPYLDEDKNTVDEIIKKNKLTDLSMENFQKIFQKHRPLYQKQKEIRQKQLETYSRMSPEQIASLSLKDKVRYIELLFPHCQRLNHFIDTCKKNEDNIKSCLFNINFPKSFWEKEKKLVNRYVSLIANSPDIMNTVKNWENSSLDDKKHVVLKSAEIFKYVYGDAPQVLFFTNEEEKAKRRQKGENENALIYAAYYSKKEKKIYFNTDKMQDRDNFFALSVMLHEGTHFRQDTQNFGDPLVDRLFHSNIGLMRNYDKNTGPEAFDFYTMQPGEIHAHGMQEYMENTLTEKTGIEKKQLKKLDKETKYIHNKAFSMAKISQYSSSK